MRITRTGLVNVVSAWMTLCFETIPSLFHVIP